MLTRNREVRPIAEYYNDSLLTPPKISDTIYDNLAMSVATPSIAMNLLDSHYAKSPEGQAMLDMYNAVKLENETPGLSTSQWLIGEGANMLGTLLHPAYAVLGGAGGVAARGVMGGIERVLPEAANVFMHQPLKKVLGESIGQYLPEQIGKEGAKKTLSSQLMADTTLENFGVFAGYGVPSAIVDNFKADTNHIEWGGVARSMGEMGAFGIAIGSIPFAWGIVRGKVNRGAGKAVDESISDDVLAKAYDNGHITKSEHDWYIDYKKYLLDPSNTELSDKLRADGTKIINENGHRANAVTNEAMFEMLTPDDMTNLHGAISDQLVSAHLPESQRVALSNFIIHGRADFMRERPEMMDGVRGYVDFVREKLQVRGEKLKVADAILDEHLLKGVKENLPFSQKEMLKYMKKSQFESSHLRQLPLIVPENMLKHLKIQEKINKLSKKVKAEKRRGLEPNKQTVKRIAELKESQPKVLTPKEELMQLRQTLIGEKGLSPNWERSTAYHRLLDLSHVWHNARTLLERVHLEHEYNRQTAFHDLAKQTLKIADSDMTRLAKPENVMDYIKARIEGTINKVQPLSELNRAVEAKEHVPVDAPDILSEQAEQFKDTAADKAKVEMESASEKFNEFKASPNIFKNLISCVMGRLGG